MFKLQDIFVKIQMVHLIFYNMDCILLSRLEM